MFNLLKNIWEYLLFPWQVEVIDKTSQRWSAQGLLDDGPRYYYRECITYKYTHRFRPQVKIVRKYLN